MFNIGEMLKIDIVMAGTTQTIKKGNQVWSCVELVLELVWNLLEKVSFFMCILEKYLSCI